MSRALSPWGPSNEEAASRVTVIGSGYVGLTTATCLAHLGHQVVCTDVSVDRLESLRAGTLPIVEEALPELFHDVVTAGRLTFSGDNRAAVATAHAVFLCLPTPQGDDGRADLRYVCDVAQEIGPALATGAIVINKSTVPVGTADLVSAILCRDDVSVVSNPEFLAEGTAVHDFLHPDRIVIGSRSSLAARRVAALYQDIDVEPIITDAASAELTKYAANAFLATKLTFVNSIASICEGLAANIHDVMRGMGAHRPYRLGIHQPGAWLGWIVLSKDTQALIQIASDAGYEFSLLETVVRTNREHAQRIVEKVNRILDGGLDGAVVAMLGLTFKAGTDDLRDSPALRVAAGLSARGAVLHGYDPAVTSAPEGIEYHASVLDACGDADVLVIMTEWPEFANLDLAALGGVMNRRLIVDARNLLDPNEVALAGFDYAGVGIGHQQPAATDVAAAVGI